jgi:glycosyltransferase involved in cell wall biosynthesis
MHNPTVTFVVPCFNMAELLPRCINSILNQSYKDLEVLVMDNCSLDNTFEVVESFKDPRIRYVRNETNIGHIGNFNRGISLGRGKYVWVVAADDSFKATKAVKLFVEAMEKNTDLGYIFCRAVELRGEKETDIVAWTDCGERDRIWSGGDFLLRLLRNNCIAMSSCMARKECYGKITLFRSDMPHASDWYLWCAFALKYHVGYVAEPMVYFREHEASLTSVFNHKDPMFCIADELRVLWEIRDQLTHPKLRRICHDAIAWRLARAARVRSASDERGYLIKSIAPLLEGRLNGRKDKVDLWPRIYVAIGDEQYDRQEYSKAMRSYLRGLRSRCLWPKTWLKITLLYFGSCGARLRKYLKAGC